MRRVAVVVLVGLALLWPISKSTTFQFFGEAIDRVETDQRVVALTFDDGPSRKHTQTVLDILASYNATATFFLTGHEAEQRPELVAAIFEAGHSLGNHSYSHERMILRSPSSLRAELDRTDAILRGSGYEGDIPFRPPYFQKLFSLPWVLRDQDRPSIMADVTPNDQGVLAEDFAAEVLETVQPGSIIVMHVMYDSRASEREALPLVLDGLRAKGFELVTVNELLSHRN